MQSNSRGISIRVLAVLAGCAALTFALGCGSNGGTPAGVQISVSLSASAPSVNPGQTVTVTASVTNDTSNKGVSWSLSPSGFGTLSNQTTTSVTYTAPTSVPTAGTATITATSNASSAATASVQIAVQTSAITISLTPAAPQTVNQGGTVVITAAVTNDPTNAGVTWSLSGPSGASLSPPTATSETFNAPTSVSSNTAYTVTATSKASKTTTASIEITVFPSGAGPNVAALNVNSGPAANSTNIAFISVTVCEPGVTPAVCQTIDNIQVDTGSEGLRILQSALTITLPQPSGLTGINNCVSFLDGSYLWGPVVEANVQIGNETADDTLMQVISSSNSGVPTDCSNGGTVNENTPTLLGANGIIGVGPEPTDCFTAGVDGCDGSAGNSTPPPVYFSCPSTGCTASSAPVFEPEGSQVVNPVVLFATDNNGVVLSLPSISGSAATASGSLIFGIDTQTNNSLGTATVFTLDGCDTFITAFNNQNLENNSNCTGPGSFIDSGSNGLFFPDSSLPACSSSTPVGDLSGFYCPTSLQALTANMIDPNVGTSKVVDFNIDNAQNLLTGSDTAFSTLGGSAGGNGGFDWGLPFFYGRSVFTAIDGATVGTGSGPFWAF
jgi:Protein of unknown function (DUF3443)